MTHGSSSTFIRRNRLISDDAPNKSRFVDKMGERSGELNIGGGKGLQPWRGSGGNWNL